MRGISSLLLSLCILFIIASQPVKAAELSSSDKKHAREAFLFVERKGWNDALQHAKKASNPLLRKTVEWLYYLDVDSDASFEALSRFIKNNPDWPEQEKLLLRAEQALCDSFPSANTARTWLEAHPPQTGRGKILLVESARLGGEQARRLVREAWVHGDFESPQEVDILQKYRTILRKEDHIARTDRLLWDNRVADGQRMLPLVPAEYQALFNARIALIRDSAGVPAALNKVRGKLQQDVGLVFNRLAWRYRKGQDSGVKEILLSAPATVPYPEKWWKMRERAVRKSLESGDSKLAYRLLQNHGQEDGAELAEALWLRGWINLEFRKNAKDAYKDFYALYKHVKYPVSKARGAYWAGRAAEKNGNRDIAKDWFSKASAYPTTFYGQIAAYTINRNAPLRLPSPPTLKSDEKRKYQKKELARIAILLAEANQPELAMDFISELLVQSKTLHEHALAADISNAIDRMDDGVKAAKQAMQHDVVLVEIGYPVFKSFTPPVAIEKSLVHAITRQESQFDRNARSPSDALGLMQLLPSTAKETARKSGVGFSRARLFETNYNLNLGSTYLYRLIGSFNGSYIQAIAAYNAGPGNVRKWNNNYGPPRKAVEAAINWIERIPFEETRNYVQRVIENLQVYRHIMSDGKTAPHLKIAEDLVR